MLGTLVVAVLCMVASATSAAAATQATASWTVSGGSNVVHAIETDTAGNLYVGGSFQNISYPTTGVLSATTSDTGFDSNVSRFPATNVGGYVLAVEAAPDGGWFVGGSFTSIGGVARTNVAKITAAGEVDPTFTASAQSGIVNALAVDASGLYIGGTFTSVNSQSRVGVARVSPNSGSVDTWNAALSGSNSSVNALELDAGDLYVGGDYDSIGGATRYDVAKLSTGATATADPTWAANTPSAWGSVVYTLLAHSGYLYVGGVFATLDGVASTHLARATLSDGTGDTNWKPNPALDVLTLDVDAAGTTLYFGGSFSQVAGGTLTRDHAAAVSTANGAAVFTSWNPKPGNNIRSLVVDGSYVILGGAFTLFDGQSTAPKYAAKVSASAGTLEPTWDLRLDSNVGVVKRSGSRLFVGGNFTRSGFEERRNLAKIRMDGVIDRTWRGAVDGTVRDVHVRGSDVFVGGEFLNVASGPTFGTLVGRPYLAVFSASGAGLTSLVPSPPNSPVYAIDSNTTGIYLGGVFNRLSTATRNFIGRLNTSSTAVDGWVPSADAAVYDFALSGTLVYAGGQFTQVAGGNRLRINRMLSTSSGVLDGTFFPAGPTDSAVRAVELHGTTVLIGGTFTTPAGMQYARSYTSTGADAAWNPRPNGNVLALLDDATGLYVGGAFTTLANGATSRARLARYLPDLSGIDPSWDPGATVGDVNAFATSGSDLYAGGAFLSAGGRSGNLVRFDVSANAVPAAPTLGGTGYNTSSVATNRTLTVTSSDSDIGDTLSYDVEVCSVAMAVGQTCAAAGGTLASVTATQTVPADGNAQTRTWNLTGLADRTRYFWHARVKDQANATSGWSASEQFTVLRATDTTAPRHVTFAPTAPIGWTNITPTVSVTATLAGDDADDLEVPGTITGRTLTIFREAATSGNIGTQRTCPAVAGTNNVLSTAPFNTGSSGTQAISTPATPNGCYRFEVATSDGTRTTTSSYPASGWVQVEHAPVGVTLDPANPTTVTGTPSFSGTATNPGAGVNTLTLTAAGRANAQAATGSTTCTGAAAPFTCTFPTVAKDGTYDVTATATSFLGGIAAGTATQVVQVDDHAAEVLSVVISGTGPYHHIATPTHVWVNPAPASADEFTVTVNATDNPVGGGTGTGFDNTSVSFPPFTSWLTPTDAMGTAPAANSRAPHVFSRTYRWSNAVTGTAPGAVSASVDDLAPAHASVPANFRVDYDATPPSASATYTGLDGSLAPVITYTALDTSGSGVASVEVLREAAANCSSFVGTYVSIGNDATPGDGTFTDTGTAPGMCYRYQLVVTDNVGNEAAPTAVGGADAVTPQGRAVISSSGIDLCEKSAACAAGAASQANTQAYTVRLNQEPQDNEIVTVSISAQPGVQIQVGAGGFGSSATLTFGKVAPWGDHVWNTDQTVTVRAVDDATIDGARHSATITHSIATAGGGGASLYQSLPTQSFDVDVTEDDVASLAVDTVSVALVEETTDAATVNLVLGARPQGPVDVLIAIPNGRVTATRPGNATAITQITVSAVDWNSTTGANNVDITLTDDDIAHLSEATTATFTVVASGADAVFNGVTATTAITLDNDEDVALDLSGAIDDALTLSTAAPAGQQLRVAAHAVPVSNIKLIPTVSAGAPFTVTAVSGDDAFEANVSPIDDVVFDVVPTGAAGSGTITWAVDDGPGSGPFSGADSQIAPLSVTVTSPPTDPAPEPVAPQPVEPQPAAPTPTVDPPKPTKPPKKVVRGDDTPAVKPKPQVDTPPVQVTQPPADTTTSTGSPATPRVIRESNPVAPAPSTPVPTPQNPVTQPASSTPERVSRERPRTRTSTAAAKPAAAKERSWRSEHKTAAAAATAAAGVGAVGAAGAIALKAAAGKGLLGAAGHGGGTFDLLREALQKLAQHLARSRFGRWFRLIRKRRRGEDEEEELDELDVDDFVDQDRHAA